MRGRALETTQRPNAQHGPTSRQIRAAGLAYSLMSRSGAGGMRGGEGERTSAPVTV